MSDDRPAKIEDVDRIASIIENRKASNSSEPHGIPAQTMQGAHWWIKFLEPRQQYEVDRFLKKAWQLPYQNRIADCLIIYYKLSGREQSELLAMREREIYWRGDSLEFMRIRQKVDMNKLDKANMKQLLKKIIKRA